MQARLSVFWDAESWKDTNHSAGWTWCIRLSRSDAGFRNEATIHSEWSYKTKTSARTAGERWMKRLGLWDNCPLG